MIIGISNGNVFEKTEENLTKNEKEILEKGGFAPYFFQSIDGNIKVFNYDEKDIQPFMKRYLTSIGKDPTKQYLIYSLFLIFIMILIQLVGLLMTPNYTDGLKKMSEAITMQNNTINELKTNLTETNATIKGLDTFIKVNQTK